jgi:glutamyl-tRNA synthetase
VIEDKVMIDGSISPPTLDESERAFCAEAAAIAETIDWLTEPWTTLTQTLKTSTGRKGKSLFLPLRLALTGRDHGPEMAALLPLIGRERAIARLRAAAA